MLEDGGLTTYDLPGKEVARVFALKLDVALPLNPAHVALGGVDKTWGSCRALPKVAWDFQDFDLLVGGRSSTAVRIENGEFDLWALRAEDPDKDVAGRVWSTEIVIGGEVGSRPYVSLRLGTSIFPCFPPFRADLAA